MEIWYIFGEEVENISKIKLKSSSIKRYKAKFKLGAIIKSSLLLKIWNDSEEVKKRYYSVYSDCIKVKVTGH